MENSFIVSYLFSDDIHNNYNIKSVELQEGLCAVCLCENGNGRRAESCTRDSEKKKFSTGRVKLKMWKKLTFTQFPPSFPQFFAKKAAKNAQKRKKWKNVAFFQRRKKEGCAVAELAAVV